MKRSLIAMAVATAMVVPATSAVAGDVKVYGAVQVELTSVTYETEDIPGGDIDGLGMSDNGRGRVGLKASEDLGNGWKGLAKLEFKADTSDNDTGNKVSLGARESMVGLKGKSFQIELGNLKQAYKYTGGVKYDPFVATQLEARGNGGMVAKPAWGPGGQKAFHNEAIGVRTKAGPIKLQLTYGPSENDGSMTASAMFKKGGIEAFVALADSGDAISKTVSYSATKIGGKMKLGKIAVTFQHEMTEDDDGTTTTEPTYTHLGAQMKMGKNIFVGQYGMADMDTTGGGTDITMITLGAIHKFSKTTRLFGGYRTSSTDDEVREDVISVGLRKDFK